MKKFIPPVGEADFRNLRRANYGFVDKSFFIRDVLADSSKVLCFPRPRRFGKSTNLSMLGYFLRKADENLTDIFDGLEVTRDPDTMKHFQRYPVITISFKDAKGATFVSAMKSIREQVVTAYREHVYLLEPGRVEDTLAQRLALVRAGKADDDDLKFSLLWLSQALYAYHNQPVVILIDEYDTPIQSGYLYEFFDDVVLFFRNFFAACLKDNPALYKGVLTGILRVSKENLFSGLNHIMVHSIIQETYNTAFGFTEKEVAAIVEPDRLDEVRSWYNGYNFGGEVIYNPWSILHYIYHGKLQPYWVNSGSSDLIETLAVKQGLGLTTRSETLLQGGSIDVPVDSNIVLRDIDKNDDALWNFLLFAGYLKPVEVRLVVGRYCAKLAIPNQEVKLVYEDMFRIWLHKAAPEPAYLEDLVKALFSGDTDTIRDIIEEMFLNVLSYHDGTGQKPEKLYHGFILGMLVHLENQYEVRSNRESGFGRADVLIRPKQPGQPGVVIEFKVRRRNESPEQALLHAAEQIRARQYAAELLAAGASPVYEYAMVFDGKNAYVKRVADLLPA